MARKSPEDKRVKFPALAHMTRLGYRYLPTHASALKTNIVDKNTQIILEIFRKALVRINHREIEDADFERILNNIQKIVESNDLGEKFTEALQVGIDGWKLIDFANIKNNDLGVTTEISISAKIQDSITKKEFRPDILVYVNGLPISFVEVKRENNLDGVQAELKRMNERSKNSGYRYFLNMLQFVSFTNNLDYNDSEQILRSGGFYTAVNQGFHVLNRMRDEEDSIEAAQLLPEIKQATLVQILNDNNAIENIGAEEFTRRLDPTSPTNAFLTSLYRPDRLFFLLRYGIAYRKTRQKDGILRLEKHIMRYPQIFATQAIENFIRNRHSRGVIWHTQGSGKTALAYFNVRKITDYFEKENTVAQFFFIVDRLDLAEQAKQEFEARGLSVTIAQSREDFARIASQIGSDNADGKRHITVVNIQKFSEDSRISASVYATNVKRIYFIDEAHRSYDPRGSFLANLFQSDRNAIIIALTGTPLLGGKATKAIFGPYIHTYYYNQSIQDGYTLRLMREPIETTYQEKLSQVLKEAKVKEGSSSITQVKEHINYIKPLAEYVAEDLKKSRLRLGDDSIGGMVVCCSTKQARALYRELCTNYKEMSFGLILHDEGDKASRGDVVSEFKKGTIDLLIVYNMLLTGFDAPRLKRLYLERLVAKHNLLQTLTRVNRPYKNLSFGSVIDFADIEEEFEKTNQAYLNELKEQLGDEWETYTKVLISKEEIEKQIKEVKSTLCEYDLRNVSVFIDEINAVENYDEISNLKKALTTYLALYNQARMGNNEELFELFDIQNARKALNEVKLRSATLSNQQAVEQGDYSKIIEEALDATQFHFTKLSEEELEVADSFINTAKRLHNERKKNSDPEDPEYITLLEEMQALFKKKNFVECDKAEMKNQIEQLENYIKKVKEINARNFRLTQKYNGDEKFMRAHKRIQDNNVVEITAPRLIDLLSFIKKYVDETLEKNQNLINNMAFFEKTIQQYAKKGCDKPEKVQYKPENIKNLASIVSNEYFRKVGRIA